MGFAIKISIHFGNSNIVSPIAITYLAMTPRRMTTRLLKVGRLRSVLTGLEIGIYNVRGNYYILHRNEARVAT